MQVDNTSSKYMTYFRHMNFDLLGVKLFLLIFLYWDLSYRQTLTTDLLQHASLQEDALLQQSKFGDGFLKNGDYKSFKFHSIVQVILSI